MRKNRTLNVYIEGGLGNQLFQYFAGTSVCIKNDLKLNLLLNYDLSPKRSSILDLKLPFAFNYQFITESCAKRLVNKIMKSKFKNLSEIGFVPEIFDINQSSTIRGYFQSYIYPDIIRDKIRSELMEIEINSWSEDKISEIKTKNPIVIHIRRGDYKLPKNGYFGILNSEYYLTSLSKIQYSGEEIWIFSDETELVPSFRKEFEKIYGSKIKFILPKTVKPDLDSLNIISKASKIIIANSTYSWWAAYLSNNSKIYAPNKWFKLRDDPLDLYPKDWNLIRSSWE